MEPFLCTGCKDGIDISLDKKKKEEEAGVRFGNFDKVVIVLDADRGIYAREKKK